MVYVVRVCERGREGACSSHSAPCSSESVRNLKKLCSTKLQTTLKPRGHAGTFLKFALFSEKNQKLKRLKKLFFSFVFYICIIYIKGRQVAKTFSALLKETHGVRVDLCMDPNMIRFLHILVKIFTPRGVGFQLPHHKFAIILFLDFSHRLSIKPPQEK